MTKWQNARVTACTSFELLGEEIYKLQGQITREFIGLRMRNFHGIVFM